MVFFKKKTPLNEGKKEEGNITGKERKKIEKKLENKLKTTEKKFKKPKKNPKKNKLVIDELEKIITRLFMLPVLSEEAKKALRHEFEQLKNSLTTNTDRSEQYYQFFLKLDGIYKSRNTFTQINEINQLFLEIKEEVVEKIFPVIEERNERLSFLAIRSEDLLNNTSGFQVTAHTINESKKNRLLQQISFCNTMKNKYCFIQSIQWKILISSALFTELFVMMGSFPFLFLFISPFLNAAFYSLIGLALCQAIAYFYHAFIETNEERETLVDNLLTKISFGIIGTAFMLLTVLQCISKLVYEPLLWLLPASFMDKINGLTQGAAIPAGNCCL